MEIVNGHLPDGQDAKSALVQFLQRYTRKPIAKDDVVYTTQRYATGFQSVVNLPCLQNQEFAGAVADSAKNAEKEAAGEALKAFAQQLEGAWPLAAPKSKNNKKRKATAAPDPFASFNADPSKLAKVGEDGTPAAASAPVENAANSAKSQLNAACMKILRKVMTKGDLTYETGPVQGGYQTIVKCSCLGDQHVYAGQVSPLKKDAEQSAAQMALESLNADPQLQSAMNAPKQKAKHPSGSRPYGGKGGGKFKGGGGGYGMGMGGMAGFAGGGGFFGGCGWG